MVKTKQALFIAIGISGLLGVRAFESSLFYDPLLTYYKGAFQDSPLPELAVVRLTLSYLFRYTLNTVCGLLLIHTIFQRNSYVKFSAIILAITFILTACAFWGLVARYPDGKMEIFYVRRFLIQPLLILILIPGLFYQQASAKRKRV